MVTASLISPLHLCNTQHIPDIDNRIPPPRDFFVTSPVHGMGKTGYPRAGKAAREARAGPTIGTTATDLPAKVSSGVAAGVSLFTMGTRVFHDGSTAVARFGL